MSTVIYILLNYNVPSQEDVKMHKQKSIVRKPPHCNAKFLTLKVLFLFKNPKRKCLE